MTLPAHLEGLLFLGGNPRSLKSRLLGVWFRVYGWEYRSIYRARVADGVDTPNLLANRGISCLDKKNVIHSFVNVRRR